MKWEHLHAKNADYPARYTATPDDDVFRFLSRRYASVHPRMSQDVPCQGPFGGRTDSFRRGITNGAEWYPLRGEGVWGCRGG